MSPVRSAVFDPSVLANLPMVADGSAPAFARQILDLFRKCAAELLARIERASAAGDLGAQLVAVHALKSSAACVGARELADVAAGLERALRAGDASSDPALNIAFVRFEAAMAQADATERTP